MKLITKYEYNILKENYIFWYNILKKLTFGKVELVPVEELMKEYIVINL